MTDRAVVRLTEDERRVLDRVIRHRRCSPSALMRARILWYADDASDARHRSDDEIARTLHTSASTAYRTRRRYAALGLDAALFPGAAALAADGMSAVQSR